MASILIHIDIYIIRFAIVFIHLHIHSSVIYILTKSLITAFTIANVMKTASICEVIFIYITSQIEIYPLVNVIIT